MQKEKEKIMKKMTEKSLLEAFAGESQAHIKYMIYAEKAEKDGKPNIARLFNATAHAEFIHAKNHFNALKKLHSTEENLTDAREGENFEIEEMYPAYAAIAELQNETEAARSIHFAEEAEKIHRKFYDMAKKKTEAGEDISSEKIYICPVCGFTHIGTEDVPEKCPICGAPKAMFVEF